jgi:SAM-dependent methyltransferase
VDDGDDPIVGTLGRLPFALLRFLPSCLPFYTKKMKGKVEEPSDGNSDDDENDDDEQLQGNFCTETFTYYQPAPAPAPMASPATTTHDMDDDATNYTRPHYIPLRIQVESATSTTGGNIVSQDHDATGIMIWPATHLLCQHLAAGDLLHGNHVLELGCGVGLVGITAVQATKQHPLLWVSTDMDQRALDLCRQNFAHNKGSSKNDNGNHSSTNLWTRTLHWGDQGRADELLTELREHCSDKQGRFDSVVGADIVYPSTCGKILDGLFASVDVLLKPNGVFWLSFATRDGPVTPSRLLEAASQAGFAVTCLAPLDAEVIKFLPPLLDSKLLVMRRSLHAKAYNDQLGLDNNCVVFPRLREKLARLEETSSDEEWDGPPLEDM